MHILMVNFDIKKLAELDADKKYQEIYHHFLKAEQMIASSTPDLRRFGRRLKRQVMDCYTAWFGNSPQNNSNGKAAAEI